MESIILNKENQENTSESPKTNTFANLSYLGYILSNIELASKLSEFKQQFIKEYSLDKQISENDEIKIFYGEKKEVENDSDYQMMLNSFNNKSDKNNIVYIETKIMPVYLKGGKSIEFEEEIKNVVERELLIAANNIKKCLTTNLSFSNSKKVRIQLCSKCNEQIIGYLYKKISPDEEDCYYCELCSTQVEEPLFKIN